MVTAVRGYRPDASPFERARLASRPRLLGPDEVDELGEEVDSLLVLPLRLVREARDGRRLVVEISLDDGARTERRAAPMSALPSACRCLTTRREIGLREDGAAWGVGFAGATALLRDGCALRSLARCLEEPWTEIEAPELLREGAEPLRATEAAPDALTVRTTLGDAGPVIDDRAREAYRTRLAELRRELDDAERDGDPTRVERMRGEIESLGRQLAAAFGLGGRRRRLASDVERARTAATKRLRMAIRRIEGVHLPLAGHLAASIRTGVRCGYFPPPGPRAIVTARPRDASPAEGDA
jgi:non-specific serine/threonine protein kinase